ncbi:MAG: galactokinase [Cytophagaceae bacterium]|nr:galactokinase [Cytophagaceae bacterium]
MDLKKEFLKRFDTVEGVRKFFAPGRVNLIGEHIDYNGGFVFPAALTIGITALVRENSSNVIRMSSLNAKGDVVVKVDEEIVHKNSDWGNYPKGVIKYLRKEGYQLKGCDILYYSTLPDGAGLSSSASIEIITAFILLTIAGEKEINRIWLSKFCQKVENEFLGVNCGIMDQFSIAMGKEKCALFLNCNTLNFKYVNIDLADYTLVIINTNKKRELSDSKYNERRIECEEALQLINKNEPVRFLCAATQKQIDSYVPNEILRKRARHVVSENQRVIDAVNALESENLKKFAKLMTQSHMSLKNDYEVTGYELDTLVEEALSIEGCIGARMTGAGFGGCAIALVEDKRLEIFKNSVSAKYAEKTGLTPSFYDSRLGQGVSENLVDINNALADLHSIRRLSL